LRLKRGSPAVEITGCYGLTSASTESGADTGFGGQEADDPAQEAPVLHRRPAQPGHQREHLLRGDPVRLEVVLTARMLP